jgi:hypothetical protein
MRRICLMFVSLLAVLTATRGLAQKVEEASFQRLPSVDLPPQVPPSPDTNPAAGNTPVTDAHSTAFPASVTSTGPAASKTPTTDAHLSLDKPAETPPVATLRDFLGYRYSTSSLEWIPGGGDQFGMFSIVSDHYQKSGENQGIGVGLGFHFLAGPEQTDMPPRVFDFSLAYQFRKKFGPVGIDLATSVLAASDFEGNARKGILFPSHAVGFYSVKPEIDLVFGVDYLDRGDIKLLPVAGLIWAPNFDMRFELVFPRPRAIFQLTEHHRLYVGGELGGGSWAIERVDLRNDLATYSDLRACIGVEYGEREGRWSAFEVAYLFNRRLEYTSGIGDMRLDDAVMLRLVTRY